MCLRSVCRGFALSRLVDSGISRLSICRLGVTGVTAGSSWIWSPARILALLLSFWAEQMATVGGRDRLFSHRPACCPLLDLVVVILSLHRSRNSRVDWFRAEVKRGAGVHCRCLFLLVSCSFFSWGQPRSLFQEISSAALLPAHVTGRESLLCSGKNSIFTLQRK